MLRGVRWTGCPEHVGQIESVLSSGFISAFKFACYYVCQVLLACLCHVFEYHTVVLNFLDTQYHL